MSNNILSSKYIGHIKKNHKGGFKIINDSEDKNILTTRNFILGELSNILGGRKELMYDDIPHYIQALEGKYVRNKMCKGGSASCVDACDVVKKAYKTLVQKSVKEYNNPNLFNVIKGGSKYLYQKIGKKLRLSGGNPSVDREVDAIARQIIELDDQCTPESCRDTLRTLSTLRKELNKAWVNSSYCNKEDNCFTALSNYIIDITPKIRRFKENLDTSNSDIESETLTPRQIRAREEERRGNSRGGDTKIYDMYDISGSDQTLNDGDKVRFNNIMDEYCGDQCTIADSFDNNDDSNDYYYWGNNKRTEDKIRGIDKEIKEWIINHWIYADNHYKINFIIILLEDAYAYNKKNKIDSNIFSIVRRFITYHTCSGPILRSKKVISMNFRSMARQLREIPEIKILLENISVYSNGNNIDDFCETHNIKSNFKRGGNDILYNYYNQNGGNISISKLTELRNEIHQIRYSNN